MRTRVFSLLVVLTLSTPAFALTALKQVQISNGSQVDLLFDGKVSRNQVKTEFFNDVIQISLNGVSVYPAKISSVNGGTLTKIFAYQYAPKLVRCRLSVKGKAIDYKDKIVVSTGGPHGKVLTIRLDNGKAAQAASVAGTSVAASSSGDPAERSLLERVMKSEAPKADNQKSADLKSAEKISDRIVEKAAAPAQPPSGNSFVGPNPPGEDKPLFANSASHGDQLGGAKNIPNPLGAFGKLALVVGIFALVAWGFKKIIKTKGKSDNAIIGAIGKFARSSLGGQAKLIEIVANHHLGPKRSIAVVKVGGRTLVVGITEHSINLIAQLSSDEDAMNELVEMDNPPAFFSKVLQSEAVKPAASAPAVSRADVRVTSYGSGVGGATGNSNPQAISAQAAMGLSGVRAQIRTKLEGLKQI